MKTIAKTITAVVAFATLIAWPSIGDAASKKKKVHTRTAVHRTVVAPRPSATVGVGRYRSATPQWDVYRDNGEYGGTDPDPLVRLMLRRDDPNADP